jgi:hypothetical protein
MTRMHSIVPDRHQSVVVVDVVVVVVAAAF